MLSAGEGESVRTSDALPVAAREVYEPYHAYGNTCMQSEGTHLLCLLRRGRCTAHRLLLRRACMLFPNNQSIYAARASTS
jgi:hypothetical protein